MLEAEEGHLAVIVHIHGGGFKNGSRNKLVAAAKLKEYEAAGISYISIDYPFIDANATDVVVTLRELHATLHYIARAIQFIRHNAKEWNLDTTRLGCTGGSAGAAASMWLAFHDDMADPDNADPVLRQSTRISCAYAENIASVSMDPLNHENIHQ